MMLKLILLLICQAVPGGSGLAETPRSIVAGRQLDEGIRPSLFVARRPYALRVRGLGAFASTNPLPGTLAGIRSPLAAPSSAIHALSSQALQESSLVSMAQELTLPNLVHTYFGGTT
jgi:hypothetical protein